MLPHLGTGLAGHLHGGYVVSTPSFVCSVLDFLLGESIFELLACHLAVTFGEHANLEESASGAGVVMVSLDGAKGLPLAKMGMEMEVTCRILST